MEDSMKQLVGSVLSGVIGALFTWFFMQPGFASVSEQAALALPNKCVARVGPARFTVGDRCFRDEVMVGRWDDNIYCAGIEIVCDQQ